MRFDQVIRSAGYVVPNYLTHTRLARCLGFFNRSLRTFATLAGPLSYCLRLLRNPLRVIFLAGGITLRALDAPLRALHKGFASPDCLLGFDPVNCGLAD